MLGNYKLRAIWYLIVKPFVEVTSNHFLKSWLVHLLTVLSACFWLDDEEEQTEEQQCGGHANQLGHWNSLSNGRLNTEFFAVRFRCVPFRKRSSDDNYGWETKMGDGDSLNSLTRLQKMILVWCPRSQLVLIRWIFVFCAQLSHPGHQKCTDRH